VNTKRSALIFVPLLCLHLGGIALASSRIGHSITYTLGHRASFAVDPSNQDHVAIVALTPLAGTIKVGQTGNLTVQLDSQGTPLQQLHIGVSYPSTLLSLGAVHSSDSQCTNTLQLHQASDLLTISCRVQESVAKSQVSTPLTIEYTAKQPGSAIVRLAPELVQVASTTPMSFRILTQDSSLTITP
jgi:hypothetical protein